MKILKDEFDTIQYCLKSFTREEVLIEINDIVDSYNEAYNWEDADNDLEQIPTEALTDDLIVKFFEHLESIHEGTKNLSVNMDVVQEECMDWLAKIHPLLKLQSC